MLVLEPDDLEHGIVLSAAQALDNDEFYARVDSGTNAIILPLHPRMQGDIAECQVPKRYSHRTNCPNLRVQWRKETGCCSAPIHHSRFSGVVDYHSRLEIRFGSKTRLRK